MAAAMATQQAQIEAQQKQLADFAAAIASLGVTLPIPPPAPTIDPLSTPVSIDTLVE